MGTTVSEPLSLRAQGLVPSPTMAFDARAKELQAAGRDLVNLTAGEPDFPTVPAAREAAVAAIREGFTHYTAAVGIVELRRAIAEKLQADNGLRYAPEEIAVTPGAKFALYAAMQVLCDPGDEVLIPSPYWVSYPEQAKLAGARPVFVPTDPEDGFVLRAEVLRRHLSSRSKLLVLNSPCNPTGAVIPPEELAAIGRVVLEHPRLWVLADEIYEKMVYDGHRHVSFASLDPALWRRTVTVNGLSKAYAMTGWRVGYTAAPRDVARAIAAFLSQTTSNVTSIAQRAALGALRGPGEDVAAMVAEFARRRAYLLERLGRMPHVACPPPGGAFYLFPRVAAALGRRTASGRLLADVDDFAMALLEEAGVAVVPGSGFGAPEHVRISYAASMDALRAGADRLEAFLQGLRPA
jgi:aspartate aminotransferase